MEEHSHHHDELPEENSGNEQLVCSAPRIFEGNWEKNISASDFDAVTIFIDGRVQADLDWKHVREMAREAVGKGFVLLWEIQLGLFEGLAQPLENQTQFLSLALSLEHFRDTLWKEFRPHTVGISLFRGDIDFSRHLSLNAHQKENLRNWLLEINEADLAQLDFSKLQQNLIGKHFIRLFCRDIALEYLKLLASCLPDSLPVYLFLNAASLDGSLASEFQLLNPESYDRFQLALKANKLPFASLGWGSATAIGYNGNDSVSLPQKSQAAVGICVPSSQFCHPKYYHAFEESFVFLKKQSIPFKIIAETYLTAQWDGLDDLIYNPLALSIQGKRKLQGFCAAGGSVISTSTLMGLPNEISLSDWQKTNLTTIDACKIN